MATRTEFAKNTATIKVSVPKHLQAKVAVKEKCDGKSKGLTTGLGTHAFAEALLLANELPANRQPDEVLAATFAKEFAKRDTHQAIGTWRSYHNGSRHGMNAAGTQSTRYGEDKQPARRAKAEGSKPKAKAKGDTGKAGKSEKAAGKPKAKAKAKAQAADA